MSDKKFLSDYYPLMLDISELSADVELRETQEDAARFSFSLDEFLEQTKSGFFNGLVNPDALIMNAFHNRLTPFQGLVMLVKNNFEGHFNLTMDLTAKDFLERGTYLADLPKCTSVSLVYEFCTQMDTYFEGLRSGWDELLKRYELKDEISFDSLLFFILANELFKFPVSVLGSYNVTDFAGLDENQKKYFHLQYKLGLKLMQLLGSYHLVETVNRMYDEKFRDLILKIRAKEMIISQLDIKLRLAHNPLIRSEKELETRYFEFLVISRSKSEQERNSSLPRPFSTIAGGEASMYFMIYRLKQLYRCISKNCNEAFRPLENNGFKDLKDIFIEASKTYNEEKPDERDYFIHYYVLINLLNKAIIYRYKHEMAVKFIDFTGLNDKLRYPKISREFVIKTQREVDEVIIRTSSKDDIVFKIKNVSDEDLALLHRNHLERQIEFLEGCIEEVIKEIAACIAEKASGNRNDQQTK